MEWNHLVRDQWSQEDFVQLQEKGIDSSGHSSYTSQSLSFDTALDWSQTTILVFADC